ncbi:hypothetical protein PAHA111176_20765 [Parendozoicomonas haliclonae]|uniref:Uncharacterized protein n=1 Tax=Parendozoicomonas haliclonae TaxID=1960125 RepID=A0A1X7AS52_9GAMM|nr:hypothetical protein EHSB41UT_04794 [Parendozoicomonas haliclonae]
MGARNAHIRGAEGVPLDVLVVRTVKLPLSVITGLCTMLVVG